MHDLLPEIQNLSRAQVEALPGPLVLEFGAAWCGYCQAAQGMLQQAWADHPQVRHVRIEDGKGKLLGRSFGVKLWPTLVFLQDGKEVCKLVRPQHPHQLDGAFAMLLSARSGA